MKLSAGNEPSTNDHGMIGMDEGQEIGLLVAIQGCHGPDYFLMAGQEARLGDLGRSSAAVARRRRSGRRRVSESGSVDMIDQAPRGFSLTRPLAPSGSRSGSPGAAAAAPSRRRSSRWYDRGKATSALSAWPVWGSPRRSIRVSWSQSVSRRISGRSCRSPRSVTSVWPRCSPVRLVRLPRLASPASVIASPAQTQVIQAVEAREMNEPRVGHARLAQRQVL